MTTYQNPFTGQTISPSSVSYEALTIGVNTALQWPINGNSGTPASSIIDVAATVTGLQLQLPPATQVSTGQTVLVRNIGSNPFTVTDTSGNTIVVVTSGIADFIFLTDNTTLNGVWSTVVFGAGTSSANASALAGAGLTPLNLTLNQAHPVQSLFVSSALTAASRAQFVVWNGGAGTLTLPVASTVANNWFVIIRNNGTGILTLNPVGTDTIDNNSNQQLQLTESLVLVSNGTGFNTYGYGQSVQFALTQLAKIVTGGSVVLTSAEGSNIIQSYIGALTSNCVVTLPSTVQLYSLSNNTTGSFTLTFRTAAIGAQTISVNQGQTAFVVSDGVNVFSTVSSAVSPTLLTLNPGTASVPSINYFGSPNSGMYNPAVNAVGWSISGILSMRIDSTGLFVLNGINSGSF